MIQTKMRKIAGFSLIEVMISVVVLSIGVLGMVALQSRGLQLTQSSAERSNAAMLADDLLERMRSNAGTALSDYDFTPSSPYYKAAGTGFPSGSADGCATQDRSDGGSEVATQDLLCWRQQVQELLPVDDGLLESAFAVCPSRTPDSCSASSSVVMIQVAWKGKSEECDDNICYYRLRAEL